MPSPSPESPLYAEEPHSEPYDSSEGGGRTPNDEDEDDDGFITRPTGRRSHTPPHSRSPSSSPPSKRRRHSQTRTTEVQNSLKGPGGTNGASSSSSKPTHHDSNVPTELAISILNVEPLDEFVREVADFIHSHIIHANVSGATQIEVEAKVGVLKDRRTGERLMMPTMVETILPPGFDEVTFESNLSMEQHKRFNLLLNNLMTNPPAVPPSAPKPAKIHYEHLYLVDEFYAHDANGRERRGRDKIRVTRDEKSKRVIECVNKVRLGDLNIYSPKRGADWRISVNLEIPDRAPSGTPEKTRHKNRMTYTQETSRIDLTQVTMQHSVGNPPVLLHELELEMVPSSLVMTLAAERDKNLEARLSFDEAVRVFVNNARILVRNA